MDKSTVFRKGVTFILTLTIFSTVTATNYYVSATGNDGNAGTTPATAWLTFTNVNTTIFAPGDSLLLEGGSTFTGTINLDANDADGGALNPFVISSYGVGHASIDAGNSFGIYVYNTGGVDIRNLTIVGSGMNVNNEYGVRFVNDLAGNIKKEYIRLRNLTVSGFGEVGISFLGDNGNSGFNNVTVSYCTVHDCLDRGIDMWGDFDQTKTGYAHSNLLVEHCEVYNIIGYNKGEHSGNGIVMSDVQNALIEYCVAHDSGSGNTNCGGPVGVWFWDSDQVTIQYCEAYNMSSGSGAGCDGGGFDLDGGVTNGTMQYNYSHDNDGGGFLIGQFWDARPMSNIICRYNISENDGATNGGSIYLFNISTGSINTVQIYNNTCYLDNPAGNPGAANFLMANYSPGFNDIDVYNNIFYSTGGVPLVSIPAGVGFDADFYGNLYYATGAFDIDYKGTNYGSLAAFRTGSGKEIWNTANTGVQGNPGLVLPGTGVTIGYGNPLTNLFEYHLLPTALALDNGLDLTTEFGLTIGIQDFFGNPALSGTSQDIGAYETQTLLPSLKTALSGIASPHQIELNWSGNWGDTDGEFFIQHALDNQDWELLTEIPYSPTGSPKRFAHILPNPQDGLHAFRILFTNLEGNTSQSEVLYLSVDHHQPFSVYPTPFGEEVTIVANGEPASDAVVELLDLQGKLVWRDQRSLAPGQAEVFSIPSSLPAGSYVLTISTASGSNNVLVRKK